MFLPSKIEECVTFIHIKTDEGQLEPRATGFFIGKQYKNLPPPKQWQMFFVTAQHNIVGIADRQFWFRIMDRNGRVIYNITQEEKVNWIFHTDPYYKADIALVPVRPGVINPDFMKIQYIDISDFITKEDLEKDVVKKEDDACAIGLFREDYNEEENIPKAILGNISEIPSERITTTDFGDMDGYLISLESVKGLSGSPVFFSKSRPKASPVRTNLERFAWLGGLIHGHQLDSGERNNGIAIVVPASKIADILNGEEVGKLMSDYEKNFVEEQKRKGVK